MARVSGPIRRLDLRGRSVEEAISELRSKKPIPPEVDQTVRRIIRDVEELGDKALLDYTLELDGASLTVGDLAVKPEEFQEAYSRVSREQISALKFAKRRIERFERVVLRSLGEPFIKEDGLKVRQKIIPLKSVGCYVPGGRASYPSSLLMTVVPAKVVDVERVVVCSPPSRGGEVSPLLLVAADICGVTEFYRVGGAQAVAALAYGTDTIRPVEKIFGPGSIYVTAAKLAVSDVVDIDLPAGPSELLILADASADPEAAARDLISQAEHGADSVCGLVTDSPELADRVALLLEEYVGGVERGEVVEKSLGEKGFIALCRDLDQAVEFANLFAAEHLEVVTEKPRRTAERITSAGLILLGRYSPVAASDYCVGTSHVLPTGGYARRRSGLSSLDYVKRVNVVECSKKGLKRLRRPVGVLASSEGLVNHKVALEERFRGGG